ncbi:MAG: 50S ribosomal protein L11 methyltransferase [Peptococcaceae bacterium]|nr:50S ribosomal protein L11 methyltransferase [Peptococcaceae bacterium]
MEWQELAVTVSTQAVEAVAELFYALGCTGVTIDDPNLLREYIQTADWDYHIFSLPDVSDTVVVKGYFAADEFLSARQGRLDAGLHALLDVFPGIVLRLKQGTVREDDWATAWKAYFKPVKVGQRIVIKPSWESYLPGPDELVLELDPGMAFGTGTHPTTALCIKALERTVQPGSLVYDIGTGSGVLAIACAMLGAQVKAVDLDPVAVKIARENVALNALEQQVEVYHGNLADVLADSADLVVANIIADVVIVLAQDLKRILRPGGVCLASGIIGERGQEVVEAFEAQGLRVQQVDEEKGWVLVQAGRRS